MARFWLWPRGCPPSPGPAATLSFAWVWPRAGLSESSVGAGGGRAGRAGGRGWHAPPCCCLSWGRGGDAGPRHRRAGGIRRWDGGGGNELFWTPVGRKLQLFPTPPLTHQPVFRFRFNQAPPKQQVSSPSSPHRDASPVSPPSPSQGRVGSWAQPPCLGHSRASPPHPFRALSPTPEALCVAFSKMAAGAAGLLHPPHASAQPDPAAHGGGGDGKAEPGARPEAGDVAAGGICESRAGAASPAMGRSGAEGPHGMAAPLPCPALPQAAATLGWLPARRARTQRPLAAWRWRGPSSPPGKGKGGCWELVTRPWYWGWGHRPAAPAGP